jgi:hypothetical protein
MGFDISVIEDYAGTLVKNSNEEIINASSLNLFLTR